MTIFEWVMLAFSLVVLGGGGYLFWRGLSLRPHRPDHPPPPETPWPL